VFRRFLAPALLLWPLAASAHPGTPIDFVEVIQDAKRELFPKTVYIKVVVESYSGGKKIKLQASGSGLIVSTNGYVVTNFHVVDKAVSVRCILTSREQLNAAIVGRDLETDLALLKLELPPGHKPLPAARFGDSAKLESGDFVMAMGSPFGLSRSVSFGIVSNPAQYLEGRSEFNNWIQTDAAIHPGNSGGPLVDTHGEVVGINSLATTGGKLGFAIPSVIVKRVTEQLRAKGRVDRSWSGLGLQALKDFEANTFVEADRGVLVGAIDPESPAKETGLKVGDLIVSLNGEPVDGLFVEDLPDVRRRFAELPAGVPAKLLFVRDGARKEAVLTPRGKGRVEGADFDCQEWMLTLKEINQFEDPLYYHLRRSGAYVSGVTRDANADRSGIQSGDIVVKIDGVDIPTLDAAKAVYESSLSRQSGKRKILFDVMRRGFPRKLVLDYNRTKASYELER
jgi:serine protease Do